MEAFLMEKANMKQVVLPVDLNTAAVTGARVSMKGCKRVAFLVDMGDSTGATVQCTLRQHDAASAGSSKDLSVANPYFKKAGTATKFTKVEPTVAAAMFDISADFAAQEGLAVFEVLEEVPEGQNPLQVEDMWLVQHVGKAECYNINPSAESPRSGMLMTAESKAKLSKSRKGKAAGADHYRYGQTVSPEVREKIGAAQRGKPKKEGRKVSEEGKAKIRANIEAGRSHKHWLGRTHTKEAKAKMSRPIIATTAAGSELHMASITHLRLATGLKPATI